MANNGTKASGKLDFNEVLKLCESKALSQTSAQELADKLDQNLVGKPDDATTRRYLMLLMKICRAYSIVPKSHAIEDADLKWLAPVEESPNLWAGMYGEREVLITVLSQPGADDMKKIKRRLCREAVVWKRVSHQNILEFIGVTLTNEIAVVSEWAENGGILKYVRDPPEDHEPNPVELLYESILALKHLHEKKLIHGDLRPDHILVTDEGHACLANAGLGKAVHESGNTALAMNSAIADGGSMRYLPPEYFHVDASSLVTREGDVYSMGMTIYEVLTDKKPFHETSPMAVGMAIMKGERPKKPNFIISRGYTEELWKLTEECWNADPSKRITVDNLAKAFESEVSKWKPREK